MDNNHLLATFKHEQDSYETHGYIGHVTLYNHKTKEVICSFDTKPIEELSEVIIYDDHT